MASFPIHRAAEFLKTEGEPSFETTLPRELAHKRAVEEIFLTDVIIDQARELVIAGAQLPRSHALYNEVDNGIHDLLLILEIGRQGMTIYGHIGFAVPEETAFVMSGLRAEVVDLEALRQGDGPAELVIDVPFGEERRDGRGRVRGYTLKGSGAIDGRPTIEFSGEARLIPEALYERVRSVSVGEGVEIPPPPVPADPARVGRRSPANVVVGDVDNHDGELRCALIADPSHPAFFDHPLDHVPGMLMLETARQAAVLHVGARGWPPQQAVVDACEAHFTQYAALSPPALCCVRPREGLSAEGASPGGSPAPAENLRVHFSQAGTDIGYVDMRLRLADAGG
ncbi:MAG TPA: AfsA-related hotdog domain-containing protein [Solirubrobacterales bacterium]|nr:AfsA-related hotdog domain-containing protein [Solirubrobacterales bacterium]